MAKLTTQLVCVSAAERTLALTAGIANACRSVVIHNGVDVDAAAPHRKRDARLYRALGLEAGPLVVGTVAEFRPQKGFPTFVAAAKAMSAHRDDVRFLIVSRDVDAPGLRKLLLEAGIAHMCCLVRPEQPIWKYYSLMDVFVLTSLWEGLPYTVLEAMACARPVVASDVPGTREAVGRGPSGILVPCRDAAATARAVDYLLDHPERRQQLGLAGSRDVRMRFDLMKQIRRLETLYSDLCIMPVYRDNGGRASHA